MKFLTALLIVMSPFSLAWSQTDFPNKPVTLVVATPAGGATDKTVRLLAKQLQLKWKNGVVVCFDCSRFSWCLYFTATKAAIK